MNVDWEFLTSVLQILAIDVVLSGDNAVVIALAAHRLPHRQRRLAILCGAAGAIGLRVLFTWVLAQLLGVPFLRGIGGLVLVWIAVKLLLEEEGEEHHVREAGSLFHAIWIIIMADFVMSLDNMLAVGGASEGHAMLILFGLVLSIGIIMTCSAIITEWMNRFPILVFLGAAVLAWTAAEMMIEDEEVARFIVTRHQLCLDRSWDKEFGGLQETTDSGGVWKTLHGSHQTREPRQWWTDSEGHLTHRHGIGWIIVSVVIAFVISMPRLWNAIGRRRHAHPSPPSADHGSTDAVPHPSKSGDTQPPAS